MVTLMEMYATGTAIMIVVLLEAIGVSWYYGEKLIHRSKCFSMLAVISYE